MGWRDKITRVRSSSPIPENEKEDVVFCHGLAVLDIHPCLFGSVDAFSWLRTLNSLHNNSSGDVVSFLFENQIPGDHLEYLLNVTGILEKAYVHELGDPWPSIGDLALSEKIWLYLFNMNTKRITLS